MPLESNHCRNVEHHQPSYCCIATLSYWDDDAITALRRMYHAPHLPCVSHPTLGECHMLNLAAASLHQKAVAKKLWVQHHGPRFVTG